MSASTPTPPVPPQACVDAAAEFCTGRYTIGDAAASDWWEVVSRDVLAAALAVRDENGIPELVKSWLAEHDEGHVLQCTDTGWTLSHSLACRLGDLFACAFTTAAESQAEDLWCDYGPGRYAVSLMGDDGDMLLVVEEQLTGDAE